MSELIQPAQHSREAAAVETSGTDSLPSNRAVVAVSVGLLGAFVAQMTIIPGSDGRGDLTLGGITFLIAMALVVIAARNVDQVLPLADPLLAQTATTTASARLRRTSGGVVFALGLATLGIAIRDVANQQTPSAIPFWFAALLLTAVGVGVAYDAPTPWPRSRSGWIETGVVVGVLAVGFAFRYVNLTTVPLEVHGDEAAVGLAGRYLLATGWKDLFGLGWYALPQLSFAPYALGLKYVSNDLYGIRLVSVVQGTLAIGLLYGVARRLFSRRIALLAASFFACAQMAVHYSRIGNNYVGALFASLLFFYLLLESLRGRRPLLFLLAGFAAGLTLSVYIAARLTLVIAVIYCLHRALVEPEFLRTQWRGLLIGFLGALIFLAPQGVLYAQTPGRILERTSGVFLFSEDNLSHEYEAYGVQTVPAVLLRQTENTLSAFNLTGETSDQYDQRAPLLDLCSAALFVLGAALVTWRWREPRYLLVAAWLWLTLLIGSVLTVDAVFSPHIIALLGILAILPALALEVGWRALTARFGVVGTRSGGAIAVGLILLSGYANYIDYFTIHQQAMAPNFFTVLARYAAGINSQDQVYLLADADTSLHYDTVHFLFPNVDGVDVRNYPITLPLTRIPTTKGIVFVDRDPKDPRLAAIERTYPHGIAGIQHSTDGYPEFATYVVNHADLLAAKPDARQDPSPLPAVDYREMQSRGK